MCCESEPGSKSRYHREGYRVTGTCKNSEFSCTQQTVPHTQPQAPKDGLTSHTLAWLPSVVAMILYNSG